MDHWHNDSIAYAGVVVISDMEGMEGRELELFRGEKGEGKRLLREGKLEPGMVERVNYESPGKMILTHGSEVSYIQSLSSSPISYSEHIIILIDKKGRSQHWYSVEDSFIKSICPSMSYK